MKERPILFSAPMVRALLNGSKTQTRRVVKEWNPKGLENKPVPADLEYLPDFTTYRATCPYGQPGDRLWVREAWSTHACFDDLPPREIKGSFHYLADGPIKTGKGRPSIHMPRWASRITLEVTGIRVERLQDISEADALAEGAPGYEEGIDAPPPDGEHEWSYRASFRRLWESINGTNSWQSNPHVWVIEFKPAPACGPGVRAV